MIRGAARLTAQRNETILTSFTTEENAIKTQVIIEEDGFFQIVFHYDARPSSERCSLYINGLTYGWVLFNASEQAADFIACTAWLAKGENTFTLTNARGKVVLKHLMLIPSSEPVRSRPLFDLVNPAATKECRTLMRYLSSVYGNKLITGQHTNSVAGLEIDHIHSLTGKLPALKGFDLLSYSHATTTNNMSEDAIIEIEGNKGTLGKAIEWHTQQGGIVTICWHWFAPLGGEDKTFYTKQTDFDLNEALQPGTASYEALLRDMDTIAEHLKKLREARVPVLWRPLHEADGRWFWWGAKGPEAYKALYRFMFDRYVNYHQLNNLIWVWNAPNPAWYPGDEFVDLVGDDVYEPAGNYGPLLCPYEYAVALTNGRKPVALTENGPIPDPALLRANRANWLWYMPWWGYWCTDPSVTSNEQLIKTYHHPDVITLEDLPDFSTY